MSTRLPNPYVPLLILVETARTGQGLTQFWVVATALSRPLTEQIRSPEIAHDVTSDNHHSNH